MDIDLHPENHKFNMPATHGMAINLTPFLRTQRDISSGSKLQHENK
jgi:hypothetical protein